MNNPLLILIMTGVGFYVAKLWRDDMRKPHPGGLPGTTPAASRAIWIAIAGALVILAVETAGEKALGIDQEQSKMTWLFAIYSVLAAPVIEELVFRGYLVIEGKGKAALWGGILVASLGFALIHQHLLKWENGFVFMSTPKAWFTTGILFVSSLWWYTARFAPWNPSRSLLPCMVAHGAKNAGVVLVKASTGFMGGLF
ncbi:MAG TPA: CPBP family intramembrane glutamic endopeptidase [Opitutaceae bacterium]|nr:CPBP family intramembrane glutamic endopeptidase [Opitutaceae bacterium]